ncbi:MAG: excisionase family DNA-binding protein [Isosphaeraceae bacterium]
MTPTEPYLKTQQVANELGVSVSTVKRWVDCGTIRAARTVGKHRLIPLSEAVRLAKEQGLSESRIAGMEGVAQEQVVEFLESLLREGRVQDATKLIHSLYSSGRTAVDLADQVIGPLMARIGHGWMAGSLDVYQEHEATLTVASAVRGLIDRVALRHVNSGPLALGATPEGDPYVLACLLGELLLREQGWQVRNLGSNLPLRSLGQATLNHRPRLVFISVNYLKDEDQFVREYQSFYENAAAVGAAVIVGGRALGQELRTRLVYASFGDRMAHLGEFARGIALLSPSVPVEGTRTVGGQGPG